jgi:hypothetical protein
MWAGDAERILANREAPVAKKQREADLSKFPYSLKTAAPEIPHLIDRVR